MEGRQDKGGKRDKTSEERGTRLGRKEEQGKGGKRNQTREGRGTRQGRKKGRGKEERED